MAGVRRPLIVALLLLAARPAHAQQCHPWNGTNWRTPGILLGVRFDAAGYRNRSYQGDYQGVAPMLAWSHPRISLQMMLPMYRLTRNGRANFGIGDLAFSARVPVPGWSHHDLTSGLGVTATFPTGSADAGFGMGHVMLMPEFWWLLDRGRVQLYGTAGFGRALTSTAGAHHGGGPAPVVNPMNRAEIEVSLGSQIRLQRLLWLKFGAYGAIPVGKASPEGVTRVVAAQGLMLAVRGLDLSVELQAPLTGAPFLARGVVQASYRFDIRRRAKRR